MSGQKTVESTWRGGLCCDVDMGGFSVTVDEPPSVGGTDLGPEPTSVLLASVASCFTVAIAFCARKRSVELTDLKVSVTGVYDGPKYASITISSQLGCDPSQIDGIIRAAERVCYVTNTLKTAPDIHIKSTPIAPGAA
ncbi:hypothetical protein RUESEDTHA_03747 [Ruegeria sp. THAF57]|uniref:OsmC family protein n=1 Tax=Ruegeria sp. THAF57 TaxID=2744555 RepID=UPI0015E05594|nr:OsmC family protein [Ruegeria sp. THAF57]CAD0186836.1 hypothetical protein RUESEDTHA_03747 [Ruegeria sp. THAF57]